MDKYHDAAQAEQKGIQEEIGNPEDIADFRLGPGAAWSSSLRLISATPANSGPARMPRVNLPSTRASRLTTIGKRKFSL